MFCQVFSLYIDCAFPNFTNLGKPHHRLLLAAVKTMLAVLQTD